MDFIVKHPIIKLLIVLFVVSVIAFAGFLYWFNSPIKGTELDGFIPVTGNKYAIVVTGDDYGRSLINYLGSGTDRFDEKGKEIKQILEEQYDYKSIYLATTKKSFLSEMNSFDLKSGDQLSVILMAHGGQLNDGSDYVIWIDEVITAKELNNSLNKFEGVRLFIFVSSCGSGKFIERITSVNRIIMTSGAETNINTNVPSRNFVKSLTNKLISDVDENGKVSVAELFNSMKIGIEWDYKNYYSGRMPGSDVIQIDDNADGRSTNIRLPAGSEGYLAMETFF